MTNAQILIVEDERIVAEGLQTMLKKIGYSVVGIAASADQAIQKAEETHPDLVLMDINLKGERDGIDAAEEIVARFDIPVTFLTAYADEQTLERAKETLPFGYILKPYEENTLRSGIEVAIYKHRNDAFLKNIEQWSRDALRSLGAAVIGTNERGQVSFLNPAAETLLEGKMQDLWGKPIFDVLRLKPSAQNALDSALKKGTAANFDKNQQLECANGKTIAVVGSIAPVLQEAGSSTGSVLVLQAI